MMKKLKFLFLILSFILSVNNFSLSQTIDRQNKTLTIAVDSSFHSLDTITATAPDSVADKVRNLIYDSLVTRNERLEYVGELAKDFKILGGGDVIEFILRENIKFHDGKILTSADVKFTLETLIESGGYKGAAFYDLVRGEKKPHILAIEMPDSQTVQIKLARASLKNQFLSNMVSIPIISADSKINTDIFRKNIQPPPIGTGAYKFVIIDDSQPIAELSAHEDYWQGKPAFQIIRIKTVKKVEDLTSQLKSQEIDLAPMLSSLSTDEIKLLSQDENLKVEQFKGSNVRYIGFNTKAKPFDNIKIRQAIAYAIKRDKIIDKILHGQAEIAYSILPAHSWAYAAGTKYDSDQTKARRLLNEAGLRDKNGDGVLDIKPIVFKIASGSRQVSQYAQIIAQHIKQVGLPVEIEVLENNLLLEQIRRGEFQMTTAMWVGGNQDPMFLYDLFVSSETPDQNWGGRNRSRYRNREVDALLKKAVEESDESKAKDYYVKAQEIISREVPLIPLWHPANVVIANKTIGNIKVENTGDWSFIKYLVSLQ